MKISRKKLVAIGFAMVMINRLIGLLFLPLLISQAPLLLILLSPTIFNLSLASQFLPVAIFYVAAVLISLTQCSIGYFFGRSYGEKAIRWFIKKHPDQRKRTVLFRKVVKIAFLPTFLVLPGPIMSMLAGTVPISKRLFFSVLLLAQLIWTTMCQVLGDSLDDKINALKGWSLQNALLLTLGFTGVYLFRKFILKNFAKSTAAKD